jgi:hypothetical protein
VHGDAWRRAAVVFACTGVCASVGVGSAGAVTFPGENVYGMGSWLQGVAQTDQSAIGVGSSGQGCGSSGWLGWVAVWRCTAQDHSTLSNNPTTFYTVENSGQGLAEFGDNAGANCSTTKEALNPSCDPNAGVLLPPELDAFVATDSPPTSTQLSNGVIAAGAGVDELTIPVAQTTVVLIFSLPTGITVASGQQFKLTTSQVAGLWGTNGVAVSSNCPGDLGNTWCDLLEAIGLTRITTGKVAKGEFLDSTSDDGGPVTLMDLARGSGTTFAFRGYLYEADQDLGLNDYPYTLVTNGPGQWPQVPDADPGAVGPNDWPTTAEPQSSAGPLGANGSVGALVENTAATPGSTSYADLPAAALDTNDPFTSGAKTTTCGVNVCASHQILYAYVQDNTGDGSPPYYASPAVSTGTPNLYAGADIGENVFTCTPPSTSRVVGCWIVPSTSTGSWVSSTASTPGTILSDPDVYDHGKTATGAPAKTYPVVTMTFEVAWSQYDVAGSNLDNANSNDGYFDNASCPAGSNCNTDAGNATRSYLEYLVHAGQGNLVAGKADYGRLPTKILARAQAVVNTIKP